MQERIGTDYNHNSIICVNVGIEALLGNEIPQ